MPLLAIEDLHVWYGAMHVLRGVSLDIEEGSVVTLLGPNGAGKTTTLRAISGLVPRLKGRISFDGHPIRNESPEHRVGLGIGHVPEGRELFHELTVRENLLAGAHLVKNRSTVESRLATLERRFPFLAERKKQLAGTLSGGEQQLMAIARALMGAPRLLLMDEPSLGLAPRYVDEIFQLVREINAEGTTILLVEQNARQALRIAGYAYLLERGTIALAGEAEILLQSPRIQHLYLGG